MKLTDLFIKRPVLALVVNLIILIAGFQAIQVLNVRQYPRSDISVVTVTTAYVGANADLVRGFITTPLEQVIASSDGIDYIESSSAQGISTISVHLKLNYDTNAALTQIQSKIAQVRNELPPEAEAPVVEVENADDRFASMYLSFSSEELDSNQITDFLTRVVQPKLTSVAGVQRADILGARNFAMRIWLDPAKMAAYDLSPTDVRDALSSNNYLSAIGRTKGSMMSVNLIANTNLTSDEEFRQLVVRENEGVIVRLGDVAKVELGAESYDEDVRFDDEAATFIGIWALPTANSLDVIKRVRDVLPEVEALLPPNIKLGVPYDSTKYIENAIVDVVKTLGETLLIVIVVIFFFLGSLRSVLIPVVAIPISLVGAVFLMLIAGFTINLLTLLAIVLAVGLVVDDAIVVVENVERHLQEGMSGFDAAIRGARELYTPIIAMTITLAAVYTPVGLQGGLTGALFREFAFTLAGAVVISGIVALTLSPMMSSKLLRKGDSERGFAGWVNRRLDWVRARYLSMLAGTLRYRPVVYTLAVIVMALGVIFFLFVNRFKELAPKEDQGIVFGIVQTAATATLDQVSLYTGKIYDVFASFPETDHVFQRTGPGGGFSGMVTKPWDERDTDTETLQFAANAEIGKIPGVQVFVTTPPPLPGGSQFPVEFVLSSTAEPEDLYEIGQELQKEAEASGYFIFTNLDLKYDQPQTEIIFDRDKVASLGLDLRQVGADLGTMIGGNYVNRFQIQGRSYKVIPQVQRADRLTASQIEDYYVSGPDGGLVPLSTFATLRTSTQPREIKRFQQLNSVTLAGGVRPGATIDEALSFLEKKCAEILPAGYVIDYAGESRQLRVEGSKFLPMFALSFVLIFLVLAAQFESFRDPFIILVGSVPLALSGALLFPFMGLTTLNVYSQVGLITLVGLVSKNGILIVEFANQLQLEGQNKLDAIINASGTRLRPILMTSVATVAGHFPLIIASGPGAGARNSIGWVLVTGMVIGTAFTLFVVPSIYMLIARDRRGDRPQDSPTAALDPAPTSEEPLTA
ncbi:MAG: efflux RND transporter permease subunit [Chthoniobacterales bacterium]